MKFSNGYQVQTEFYDSIEDFLSQARICLSSIEKVDNMIANQIQSFNEEKQKEFDHIKQEIDMMSVFLAETVTKITDLKEKMQRFLNGMDNNLVNDIVSLGNELNSHLLFNGCDERIKFYMTNTIEMKDLMIK